MFNRTKRVLWAFIRSPEVKELTIGHLTVIGISSLVFAVGGFVWGAVVLLGGLFVEMVCFHILWIYRDNRERDHPIAYAVGVELVNILIGGLGAMVIVLLAFLQYEVTGFSPFYLMIVVPLAFFGYAGWKIKRHLPTTDDS